MSGTSDTLYVCRQMDRNRMEIDIDKEIEIDIDIQIETEIDIQIEI